MAAGTASEVIVNPKLWNASPPDIQKIVSEEFTKWGDQTLDIAYGNKVDSTDKELMQTKAKVTCESWPQAEKDKFQKKAIELQQKWVDSQGGRVVEAWNLVKDIIK